MLHYRCSSFYSNLRNLNETAWSASPNKEIRHWLPQSTSGQHAGTLFYPSRNISLPLHADLYSFIRLLFANMWLWSCVLILNYNFFPKVLGNAMKIPKSFPLSSCHSGKSPEVNNKMNDWIHLAAWVSGSWFFACRLTVTLSCLTLVEQWHHYCYEKCICFSSYDKSGRSWGIK